MVLQIALFIRKGEHIADALRNGFVKNEVCSMLNYKEKLQKVIKKWALKK